MYTRQTFNPVPDAIENRSKSQLTGSIRIFDSNVMQNTKLGGSVIDPD